MIRLRALIELLAVTAALTVVERVAVAISSFANPGVLG